MLSAKEGTILSEFENSLNTLVNSKLALEYPGLKIQKITDSSWALEIPQKYKIGHEAHFSQVTEKYLRFLKEGSMPEWEIPNMIVKYYTTSEAYKFVHSK